MLAGYESVSCTNYQDLQMRFIKIANENVMGTDNERLLAFEFNTPVIVIRNFIIQHKPATI